MGIDQLDIVDELAVDQTAINLATYEIPTTTLLKYTNLVTVLFKQLNKYKIPHTKYLLLKKKKRKKRRGNDKWDRLE